MKLPTKYEELIMPLVAKAKGFLEAGENLTPIAFVGNFESGQTFPVMVDTTSDETKDTSVRAIALIAEQIQADYVFNIMEAWGLPKDKLNRFNEIVERYGSIGASPYKVDTVSFMLETRHGIWGCQVPLKFKAPSKKRRMLAAPINFQFMDGAEGRFTGLLPKKDSGTLH